MNLIYTGPVSYLNRQPLSNTTQTTPFSSPQAQQPQFSAHSPRKHSHRPRQQSSSPENGRSLKHIKGDFYQSKNDSKTSFYKVKDNRYVSPNLKGVFEKIGLRRRLHKIEGSAKRGKDYQIGPDLFINRKYNGYFDRDAEISYRRAKKRPGFHGQEAKKSKDKKNKQDRNIGNEMADGAGVAINTILTLNAPTQGNRELLASQLSRSVGATTRVVLQHTFSPQWPPGVSLAKDLVNENVGNVKQYTREWSAKVANGGSKRIFGFGVPRKIKRKGRYTVAADDGD